MDAFWAFWHMKVKDLKNVSPFYVFPFVFLILLVYFLAPLSLHTVRHAVIRAPLLWDRALLLPWPTSEGGESLAKQRGRFQRSIPQPSIRPPSSVGELVSLQQQFHQAQSHLLRLFQDHNFESREWVQKALKLDRVEFMASLPPTLKPAFQQLHEALADLNEYQRVNSEFPTRQPHEIEMSPSHEATIQKIMRLHLVDEEKMLAENGARARQIEDADLRLMDSICGGRDDCIKRVILYWLDQHQTLSESQFHTFESNGRSMAAVRAYQHTLVARAAAFIVLDTGGEFTQLEALPSDEKIQADLTNYSLYFALRSLLAPYYSEIQWVMPGSNLTESWQQLVSHFSAIDYWALTASRGDTWAAAPLDRLDLKRGQLRMIYSTAGGNGDLSYLKDLRSQVYLGYRGFSTSPFFSLPFARAWVSGLSSEEALRLSLNEKNLGLEAGAFLRLTWGSDTDHLVPYLVTNTTAVSALTNGR